MSSAVHGYAESGKAGVIPFEILRNKIILPVRVNQSKVLNIILDTGMPSQGLLLFDQSLAEELKLEGAENYLIRGAGTGKVSYAMNVDAVELSIGGIIFENQRVLILQNDTMSGFTTDGVLGNTLFGSHIVKIDYDKKVITLLDDLGFTQESGWEILDLTFNENNIPYVNASVSVNSDKVIDVSLYIDLASSEALELLVKPGMKFTLPEDLKEIYLGTGLSGHIYGKFGRVDSLQLGSFVLRNVPTAFPESKVRSRQREGDGILCDNALRRFHIIFDYKGKKLYIKPNSYFSKPFDQE
jgi:hypothetical protein